jgi:UDP-N-acetylglucosamine transferase subunit ALG13
MIFVTVANATQRFSRLLKAVDELAGKGVFGSEVVFIQSGNNPNFLPSHCKHEPFLGTDDFAQKVREANLIICHAGAGTLLHALHAGKVPVVMPRRKKYCEHVDDHQLELVQALASEGRVIPANEPEDLPGAIEEALRRNKQLAAPPPSRMLFLVAQAIEDLIGKP